MVALLEDTNNDSKMTSQVAALKPRLRLTGRYELEATIITLLIIRQRFKDDSRRKGGRFFDINRIFNVRHSRAILLAV